MRIKNIFTQFISLLIAAGYLSQPVQAFSGDKGTLIVLNKSEATASLISLKSGRVLKTIATGEGPHEAAVSPDGTIAVVCNYGMRGAPGSSLSVLNIPEQRVIKTISLGTYQRPHGIVFMPDGQRVLVTAEAQQMLLQVNWQTGTVEKAMPTGQNVSHMVVYAPQAGLAFVANIGSGTVTVIDVAAGKRIKNIKTGAGAEGIDLSPDQREVWVTNRADSTISIIDVQKLAVSQTFAAGSFPIRIKFTPDGRHALVSNARSGDVSVYDVASRKELRRISMQATPVELEEGRLFDSGFAGSPVPVGVLIPPDGRHAFIANTNADIISVIDLKKWQVVNRLKAGREPDGMAYTPLTLPAR